MAKHKGSTPDGLDIREAMEAIKVEFGVNVALTVKPGEGYAMQVVARAWREIEGVRIGIAWVESTWTPSGTVLQGTMLGALHKLYWKVSDLAHSGARPPHNPRPPA